jgi:hypothetical protein
MWDLFTTDYIILQIHDEFTAMHPYQSQWAVIYPKDDLGNVHRFCKDNAPMKVVLVANKLGQPNKIIGSVYSNETTVWSDVSIVDSASSLESTVSRPSFLAGNTIHWLLGSREEIQFNLETHRLSWIKFENGSSISRLIQSKDGGVRLASWSDGVRSLLIRTRQDDAHGTRWVDPLTYNLQNLLELEQPPPRWEPTIVCYCEHAHAIFIWVRRSIYMVDLNTM